MKTAVLLAFLKIHNVHLSENLKLSEVKCQCNRPICTHVLIHESVIQSFQDTREEWGSSIKVTSGHRCQAHNASDEVHGKNISHHLIGGALDIIPNNLSDLPDLARVASKYFDIVIYYSKKKFLHCHNNRLTHYYSLGQELLLTLDTAERNLLLLDDSPTE